MVLPGKEVVEPNAHAHQLTAFEYANINGLEVLFSASADGFVKAWDLTNAAGQSFSKLNKLLERNFSAPVLSMKLISS